MDLDFSLVLSGRNDNWMGTFDRVTPLMCRFNSELIGRFTRNYEIIFVEWAPLEDRPYLSHRLAEQDEHVRCFVIPKSIHDGFQPKLPFLQYHARNVGIRRARGRVVVAINADILLTPEVIGSALQLDDHTLMRAPRCDVAAGMVNFSGVDETLQFCRQPENHVITHSLERELVPGVRGAYLTNAAGDFVAMSKTAWLRCCGFHERTDASMGVDAEIIHQAEALRITLWAQSSPVYHVDHEDNQPGRMHFPEYSRHGYLNPSDWGLGDAPFAEIAPRIYRCPESRAGTFSVVVWPPPPRADEITAPPTVEHLALDFMDPRRFRQTVVACGSSSCIQHLLRQWAKRHTPIFYWQRDGETLSAEFRWKNWPAEPAPVPATLFLVDEHSETEQMLRAKGAVEGLHFAICDPQQFTTLSFLRYWIKHRRPAVKQLVLYGFGRNGRYLAEKLRSWAEENGMAMAVYDDSPGAQGVARSQNLPILTAEELETFDPQRLIVVTLSQPVQRQPVLRRLRDAGLREHQDYIVHFRNRPAVSQPWKLEKFWTSIEAHAESAFMLDPIASQWHSSGKILELTNDTHAGQFLWSSESIERSEHGSFSRLTDWRRRQPHDGAQWTRIWAGALNRPRLEMRQVLSLCSELWPDANLDSDGLQEILDYLLQQRIRSRAKRSAFTFSEQLLIFLLGYLHQERTLVHVGAEGSPIPGWLSLATAATYPKTIYSVVPTYYPGEYINVDQHPDRVQKIVEEAFRPRNPGRVARMFEQPDAAAELLRPLSFGLLVIADVANRRDFEESVANFSPMLSDTGLLVVGNVADPGAFEEYWQSRLQYDWRFVPKLWYHRLLVLERIPCVTDGPVPVAE